MSQQDQNPPAPGPRFSWGRVTSAVAMALLAAGTVAVIWLIPWPLLPKANTPTTLPMKENLEGMKKAAERRAAEKQRGREEEGEGKR